MRDCAETRRLLAQGYRGGDGIVACGLLAQFIYAVLVTVLAIVVVQTLAKLAEKEATLTAKLPFGKKSPDQ